MNQYSKMRRSYLMTALGFMAAIVVMVGILWMTAVILFQPVPAPGAEIEAEPERIVAFVEGKGVFYMEPDLLVYCEEPPNPDQWNIIREDGTIDQDETLKYFGTLQEWSDCATEYATIIRAYSDVTIMLRDSINESAGSFFMEFVEPSEEMPSHDGTSDHPGTFEEK